MIAERSACMEESIIIPTYNKSRYLRQTLQSLLAQRHAPTFEVIVIDDGSQDDTVQVVAAIEAGFPLRYLRAPTNRGRAAVRNMGLERARGAVAIFLDD